MKLTQWAVRNLPLFVPTPDGILKSIGDESDYKALTLDNGMHVVLVHNKDFQKSAYCFSIKAGSKNDPPAMPGLSCLLTHLIKKEMEMSAIDAPKNETQSKNLYTAVYDKDWTSFSGEVASSELSEIIRQQASAIADPNFEEDRTEKALENMWVSEYRKRRSHINVHKKLLDLITVKGSDENYISDSYYSNTSNVNYLSLTIGIKKFWESYYTGTNMTLVICSDLPIADMQKLAKESECIQEGKSNFAPVSRNISTKYAGVIEEADRYASRSSLAEHHFFEPGLYQHILRTTTIGGRDVLYLTMAIPSTIQLFKVCPLHILQTLFYKYAELELLPYWRKKEWAHKMEIIFENHSDSTVIKFIIPLTRIGICDHKELLDTFAVYLSKTSLTQGFVEYYAASITEVLNHPRESSPLSFAETVAINIMRYPMENILNCEFSNENIDLSYYTHICRLVADYRNWIIVLNDTRYMPVAGDRFFRPIETYLHDEGKYEYGAASETVGTNPSISTSVSEPEIKRMQANKTITLGIDSLLSLLKQPSAIITVKLDPANIYLSVQAAEMARANIVFKNKDLGIIYTDAFIENGAITTYLYGPANLVHDVLQEYSFDFVNTPSKAFSVTKEWLLWYYASKRHSCGIANQQLSRIDGFSRSNFTQSVIVKCVEMRRSQTPIPSLTFSALANDCEAETRDIEYFEVPF